MYRSVFSPKYGSYLTKNYAQDDWGHRFLTKTLQHNALSLNQRCVMDIWTCTSFSFFNTYASWNRVTVPYIFSRHVSFSKFELQFVARSHPSLRNWFITPLDFIQCINDLIIKKRWSFHLHNFNENNELWIFKLERNENRFATILDMSSFSSL